MSDLRTAAQQALEALTYVTRHFTRTPSTLKDSDARAMGHEAITALRAALEQPEQEPVAWMVYTQDGKSVCVTDNPADFIEWRSFPLFTHPPRREWRGLKEWEINDGLDQLPTEDVCSWSFRKGVYFAEAALKERNA